ncbi:MAG: hypothetical protein K2H85_06805 [Allobaculum sp.]|nr:hypothetical protein [Allobaculum sp.]
MRNSNTGNEQFSRIVKNGIDRWRRSGVVLVTGFLSPAKQTLAKNLCKQVPYRLDGGRREAIRARLQVGENEWDDQDLVSALQAKYEASKELSHRDVLGALMHAGLEREAIGDILCEPGCITLLCLPNLVPFIQQEIRQIGRVDLYFEVCNPKSLPKPRFEDLQVNIASLRADCVVAALAHCSRSQAKEWIEHGLVKVNDEALESVKLLCNNDDISIRRVGKFRIGEVINHTKKDRLVVQILKYQ